MKQMQAMLIQAVLLGAIASSSLAGAETCAPGPSADELDAVNRVVAPEVRVRAIVADDANLKISGVSTANGALTATMRKLAADAAFTDVVLVEARRPSFAKPTEFVVSARRSCAS